MIFSKQLHSSLHIRGPLLAVRIVIGCLLIWSSASKIQFPYRFLEDVAAYELLESQSTVFVAAGIPFLELTIGLLLIAGVTVSAALLTSALLFIVFFAAQASAIYRGLEISCGCFGADSDVSVNYMTLLRLGGLLTAAIVGYILTLSPLANARIATASLIQAKLT